jgi:M6 family metalloprotease-like protein
VLRSVNRKRVEVEGVRRADDRLRVDSIRYERAAYAASEEPRLAVTGSRKVVTVLCRFSDSTNVTPHDKLWFETLMGGSYPGEDHYWQETSYDNINLAGSIVVGWYDLPHPQSYHVSNGNADLTRLMLDCTGAADADVFFPDYDNVNLMFNQDIGCCAWGGAGGFTRDGQLKTYGMTWMPPWGYGNQSVQDHEMGHSFGLPHSSGPYSATYDSSWDPMSNTWGPSYCSPGDAQYGCIGAHTISYHKHLLGWIPSERNYVVNSGLPQSITIDRLGVPTSASNYLMVQIPIAGSSTDFYTVEARRFVGYDERVPAEAVVIHRVDTTLTDRNARVVDPDHNGDPNDAGARWLPGETFTDPDNGISVKITGQTTNGFNATIDTTPPTIVSRTPSDGQRRVSRYTNVVTMFSEDMDATTVNTSNIQLYEKGAGGVNATVSCDDPCRTATLDPAQRLAKKTWYEVVVWRDSIGVKDEAGNSLDGQGAFVLWSFQTGSK